METIRTKNLQKVFHIGEIDVHALRGVSLTVARGDYIAIMGPSGSGKSTLMNILGCLDLPTEGEYSLEGVPVVPLGRQKLAEIRNRKIGFVFQNYNLLPKTTALENVELPLLYDRSGRIDDHKKAAIEALERVSLAHRISHHPNQLSGGQKQRVAIARALVNKPSILLADEPTGNLDSGTSVEIISLFQELNRQGITIVLVTHEHDIALRTKRIVELKDGMIVRDEAVHRQKKPSSGCQASSEEKR